MGFICIYYTEAKFLVLDWGKGGDKFDSGIGLRMTSGISFPIVHVLEFTLESTLREVFVNSGVGSHTQCFYFNTWYIHPQ
jgi:hypothetical protein